jgi:hypothetical protein
MLYLLAGAHSVSLPAPLLYSGEPLVRLRFADLLFIKNIVVSKR